MDSLDKWIETQPNSLQPMLRRNKQFAAQRFESSDTAVSPPPPPPPTPMPTVTPPPPIEDETQPPLVSVKRRRARSYWTSARGDQTFSLAQSAIKRALALQKLTKEQREDFKRRAASNQFEAPDPQKDNRLIDGSVDLNLDLVVDVPALFVECGEPEADEMAVFDAPERRRRSQLMSAFSSTERSLVRGVRTLLSENLIYTDPANSSTPLSSFLRMPSPVEESIEVESPPYAPPPPTPVPTRVNSDSDDDSEVHAHDERARALARRRSIYVR